MNFVTTPLSTLAVAPWWWHPLQCASATNQWNMLRMRHEGKPLEAGPLIAILFRDDEPLYVVFGWVVDITFRNKPKWLKTSGTKVQDRWYGTTLHKCNAGKYELALLGRVAQTFAARRFAAIQTTLAALWCWPLDDGWPESGEMKFWRRTYIKL